MGTSVLIGQAISSLNFNRRFVMKKLITLLGLLVSLVAITGCHTATKSNWGMKRPVVVDSEPQGAEVFLNGEYIGQTPITAMVSPRSGGTLNLHMAGYADREVVLKSAVWDTAGMATGGNLAATIISPPIGGASMILDRWVLKMDKDFRLPLVKLYPLPQQTFANQSLPRHQPPAQTESWRPRWPVAPFLPSSPQLQQQPSNGCCIPAKSLEEIAAENRR